MQPTLRGDGDILILNRMAVSPFFQRLRASLFQHSQSKKKEGAQEYINISDGLERGGIYVAVCPTDPSYVVCKRLIAKEGDRLYRWNDSGERELVIVPPGHCWLQGDNNNNSTDSRHYGMVPVSLLRGQAFLRIYPQLHFIASDYTLLSSSDLEATPELDLSPASPSSSSSSTR